MPLFPEKSTDVGRSNKNISRPYRMSSMPTDSTENLTEIRLRNEPKEDNVVGTSRLFSTTGQIRYVPMPTPDPKDPLNLPEWRKWTAIAALCFFGALALSAEFIIGALVPVFVLEYAGINPQILGQIDISAILPPGEVNLNPVKLLAGLGGPPIDQVSLLASIPLLVNGIASYIMVPMSIAVGRRPMLLLSAVCAFSGGFWAGASTGLYSHLAARCIQGLGAGAVEALIPLIVQDMMFIHQRNKAISLIGASQGLIVVSLGIGSPSIVAHQGWRFLYWITSSVGVFAFILLVLFVPETRWIRSVEELAGKEIYELRPGETRPRLDPAVYGPRTNKSDFGILNVSYEWRLASASIWDTARSTLFPNVFWVIIVNSIFISMQGAAGQVGSSLLIAARWKFETLGFAVIPIVIASPFVWFFGGYVADWISNLHARRNGGRREPEAHLISLIFPLICGIIGPIVFGYAGQNINRLPGIVVLVGIFFIGFSFLTANALFAVYLVESYPNYAGPVLINVASFRLIIGFIMSFKAVDWVQDLGFFKSFGIYSIALGVACLGLPFVYFYGKRIRMWTAGRLDPPLPTGKKFDEEGAGIAL
ncbi:uncharacterized protein PpBr36_09239 [Pyricularia pennisetigena]|uniref:uncharacterized protein n=1 Tax=Pyricularia pennisetigena TaxID=1578925 RepID=UPI0011525FC1|nr:uncharacterized protein PpBr36_09239 [Pyricularia pennisetigena]TLS22097.1 hypothetical protein PpBr36_09239 [Pyricularia pennisetigena]